MASRRTRTGCKTCRSRKLKCDEAHPVCGQCRKSNRTCVPSEGITFRHAQNAGMNSLGGDLDSFFKYRQTFSNKQYFLPIPKELKFVHISDPYEDDSIPQGPADYQQVAAHTLEALSTAAAAGDPSSGTRSNTYDDYANVYASVPGRRSNSTQLRNDQNNDINFLLNPSHTPSALIDPNLEAPTEIASANALQESGDISSPDGKPEGMDSTIGNIKEDNHHFDQQVLAALQNSGESAIENHT